MNTTLRLTCIAAAFTAINAIPAFAFDSAIFDDSSRVVHNQYRNLHQNTGSLIADYDLATGAQSWAEHLLSTGNFEHSSFSNYGENLYKTIRPLPYDPPLSPEVIAYYQQHYPGWQPPEDFNEDTLAKNAAKAWHGEHKHYDFVTAQSTTGQEIGHFTQMVWKNTSELGCGAAYRLVHDNQYVEAIVVCRYQTQGNVYGQYQNNVKGLKPGANVDF